MKSLKTHVGLLQCLGFISLTALGGSCSRDPDTREKVIKTIRVKKTTDASAITKADVAKNTFSLSAFASTLYPLLRENCKSCHDQITAPLFANEVSATAHKALIDAEKINFVQPDKSRIVSRIQNENHNCWSDCQENGIALAVAVKQWLSHTSFPDRATLNFDYTTDEFNLPGAVATERPANPVPKIPNTFVFEAEDGELSQGMEVIAGGNSLGQGYISALNGGGGVNVGQHEGLGLAEYDFSVSSRGIYYVFGRIQAENDGANSFIMGIDRGDYGIWALEADGEWHWSQVREGNNPDGNPRTFDLANGAHTLQIYQRENGARLDRLVITKNPNPDFSDLQPEGIASNVLLFNLGSHLNDPTVYLEISVEPYNDQSYKVFSPQIKTLKPVRVRGLAPLLNGSYSPENGTFLTIDKVIAPPGDVLSEAALILLMDQGLDLDKLSFGFVGLEFVTP